MKNLIFALVVLGTTNVIAVPFNVATKGMTPEEKEAYLIKHREKRYRKTGGHIDDKRKMSGSIAFLNAQGRVDVKEFEGIPRAIENIFCRTVKLESRKTSIPYEGLAEAAKTTGANVTIILTDDPKLPSLLVAPEAFWASVNVAAFVTDDKTRYINRVRREMIRAFAFLCGADSLDRASVLDAVKTPDDIDELVGEGMGQETIMTINKHLDALGVRGYTTTTYRKACEAGWAPPPTNDVQKAIWDDVHKIPTKPIKIEFDPKTDTK